MIGQLLMDLSPLTPAHVLVLFVVVGGVLSGFGWYQPLIDLAGGGAFIPLTGFGHALVSGTLTEVDSSGFIGIFSGALKAAASGLTAAIGFGFLAAILFDPKG